MRRKIIYEPTLSDAALLILRTLGETLIESFWPHPYYHTFCDHNKRHSFRNAVDRAVKRKLIVRERKNGKVVFVLSSKGKRHAEKIYLKLAMAKKKRWDGKWRLFIFDIEEKTRRKRDFLRRELVDFGFYPFQKSVFVYPYPLPPEFFELWEDLNFGNQVVIIDQAVIRDDGHLRDFFWPEQ